MQEVDIEPVDLGGELLEAIEFRLARAPVVAISPIGADLLDPCQRRALAPIIDQLRLRPARAGEARLEVDEDIVADGDAARLDGGHRLPPHFFLSFRGVRSTSPEPLINRVGGAMDSRM